MYAMAVFYQFRNKDDWEKNKVNKNKNKNNNSSREKESLSIKAVYSVPSSGFYLVEVQVAIQTKPSKRMERTQCIAPNLHTNERSENYRCFAVLCCSFVHLLLLGKLHPKNKNLLIVTKETAQIHIWLQCFNLYAVFFLSLFRSLYCLDVYVPDNHTQCWRIITIKLKYKHEQRQRKQLWQHECWCVWHKNVYFHLI